MREANYSEALLKAGRWFGGLPEAFQRTPELWRHLGVLVCGKLRLSFLVVEDLALPVPTRVARRLVLFAERYGEWTDRTSRVVEVSQEQLATMLSVSRQTVNQALKELESRALLRVAYGKIEIVDHAALRALAEPP